jgi:hypothetical protein
MTHLANVAMNKWIKFLETGATIVFYILFGNALAQCFLCMLMKLSFPAQLNINYESQ